MSARSLSACVAAGVCMSLGAAAPVEALSRTGAAASARAATAAPSVQSMVVGAGGGAILSAARAITASATSVHVGARSCAVAAGTPLAVLAALRRAGGPGFALRDYGHCGASTANSGELFVYSLAGEANSGQNGWEYKVNGVAGSTGAGDPSGPLGNGRRLSSGERVLWFWCQSSGGGCQRTLEVAAPASTVPGGQLAVTVTGYDNEGRGAPVAGAIVTLGSDFASTGAGGRATLVAPLAPGRYRVYGTRRGLVPAFPETIVVR